MDELDQGSVQAVLDEIARRESSGRELASGEIADAVGVAPALVRYVLRVRKHGQRPRRLGRYGLVEAIGHGAMGVVWLAYDLELERDVALKELSPQQALNPEAVRRFRLEATAAARLEHPNLLPIYEIGHQEDAWYYAMKLVSGSSLHEQVELSQDSGMPGPAGESPQELADFLERFAAVADAVHVAHDAGILHRDIKPSNIMMDTDGTLLLVDFGLARDVDREQMTLTGASLGTPMYMSPEQFAGRIRDIDERTDVYALGITLYEVLALRAPHADSSLGEIAQQILSHDPPSPRSLGISLPAEVEQIIFRAIEKEPGRRYPSAAAFAEDLRNFVQDRPVQARPQGPFVRLSKSLRRNRAGVHTIAKTLLVLLAVGLLTWGGYGCRDSLEQARRAEQAEKEAAPGLERGREALAQGRPEEAQATWAKTFAAAPTTASGREAMIELTRALLREARPEYALRAAELLRQSRPDRRQEAIACFLAAQGALGAGDYASGLGYLQACEALVEALPRVERRRLAEVKRFAEIFTRTRTLPCATGGTGLVGRFRDDAPLLFVFGTNGTHLLDIADGELLEHGIVRKPLAYGGAVYPPLAPQVAAADLDGNGVDELLRVSHHKMSHEIGREVPERLEILDLTKTPPAVKCALTVPHATYDIGTGDFDNDGIPDLLLGMSWPALDRGVRLFRGVDVSTEAEEWQFEELKAAEFGDLLPLRSQNSEVRSVRAGDLDGDGKNELIVVLDSHEGFSLNVFRYEKGSGFRRLAPSLTIGASLGAEVCDLDGRPPQEILYGMYVLFAEDLDSSTWPTQGLYRVNLIEELSRLVREPIAQFGTLRLQPAAAGAPRPTNLGVNDVTWGRDRDGYRFVASSLHRHRGKAAEREMMLCSVLKPGGVESVLLGKIRGEAQAFFMMAANVDGQDGDEILRLVGDELHIHGTGEAPQPIAPPVHSDAQRAAVGPALLIQVAGLLADLEFDRDAGLIYLGLLPQIRGTGAERDAVLGALRGMTKSRQLDAALEFLNAELVRKPTFGVEIALERARLLEELGRLEEAQAAYADVLASQGLQAWQSEEAMKRTRALRHLAQLAPREIVAFDEKRASRAGTFDVQAEHHLGVKDRRSDDAQLLVDTEWKGESFRLVADVLIRQLDVSQNISIGFFDATAPFPMEQSLSIRVASTSGQHRSVSVWRQQGSTHWSDTGDSTPGLGLTTGRWFRCELTHNRTLRESWLRVFDRESQDLVMALQSSELEAIPPVLPWKLGVHMGHFAVAPAQIDAEVELVSLEMVK